MRMEKIQKCYRNGLENKLALNADGDRRIEHFSTDVPEARVVSPIQRRQEI
jgi:hypothetical protein